MGIIVAVPIDGGSPFFDGDGARYLRVRDVAYSRAVDPPACAAGWASGEFRDELMKNLSVLNYTIKYICVSGERCFAVALPAGASPGFGRARPRPDGPAPDARHPAEYPDAFNPHEYLECEPDFALRLLAPTGVGFDDLPEVLRRLAGGPSEPSPSESTSPQTGSGDGATAASDSAKPGAGRIEASTPTPTSEKGGSRAPFDFDRTIGKLRGMGRSVPARLLEFMRGRDGATYEDVALHVHGNGDATEACIRQNIKKLNDLLVELEAPVKLNSASGRVFLSVAPE